MIPIFYFPPQIYSIMSNEVLIQRFRMYRVADYKHNAITQLHFLKGIIFILDKLVYIYIFINVSYNHHIQDH